MQNYKQAIGYMFLRTLSVAILMAFAKKATNGIGGIHPLLLMFLQVVVATIIVVVIMAIKNIKPKTTQPALHFSRAFLMISSGWLFYYCLNKLPLNTATAITFLSPIVSSILAVLYFKEHLNKAKIIALTIGLCGVIIILRPAAGSFNWIGLLLASVTLLWGLIDINIKLLTKTEGPINMMFFGGIMAVLIGLPLAIYHWQIPTLQQGIYIVVTSLAWLTTFYATIKAFSLANISAVMPFDFTKLIFAIILSYFMFDETIDIYTIIGSFVIMCGVVYLSKTHENKNLRHK